MTSQVIAKNVKIHWSDPKYIAKKRENKNLESFQQGLLLAILNEFCGVTLEKRRRKSVVTVGMPSVRYLHFGEDVIDVKQLAEIQCYNAFEEEIQKGKNKQTTLRRYEKNKRIFVHNLLLDICIEKGFFFNSKLSKKSAKSLQLERITQVFFNYSLIYNSDEIVSIGGRINDYLSSLVATDHQVTLQQNDSHLYQFITHK
ncbi:TATA-binding protein-associated phosphoprotein [Entamoeba marina]